MTRNAVGPAGAIHTRMPIPLPKATEAAWLDCTLNDATLAIELARERAVTAFVHYPFAQRVNNARNEGAELIAPLENPA